MYNRYVPQPDGTFRRDRLPEQLPLSQEASDPSAQSQRPVPQHWRPSSFLQQLLPKDFDTGDLLVILLLLLMAGDHQENRSNAILTIALYLLM